MNKIMKKRVIKTFFIRKKVHNNNNDMRFARTTTIMKIEFESFQMVLIVCQKDLFLDVH